MPGKTRHRFQRDCRMSRTDVSLVFLTVQDRARASPSSLRGSHAWNDANLLPHRVCKEVFLRTHAECSSMPARRAHQREFLAILTVNYSQSRKYDVRMMSCQIIRGGHVDTNTFHYRAAPHRSWSGSNTLLELWTKVGIVLWARIDRG